MTYGDALIQARGTNNAIDPGSVLQFLSIRLAATAYRERNIAIPIPLRYLTDTLAMAGSNKYSSKV